MNLLYTRWMRKENDKNRNVDFEDLLRVKRELGSNADNGYSIFELYPEQIMLGPNIRKRNKIFEVALAVNMFIHGQIQECSGDTLEDGETIRVWGGHRRYWSVELINSWIEEHNRKFPADPVEKMKLRVRAKAIPLSWNESLQLMISENFREEMKPEDEAAAIFTGFQIYEQEMNNQSKKYSLADFARRIGFGESKVRNAVRYEGLVDEVKELVELGALGYSVAVIVSKVSKEKQFDCAIKIINRNLDRKKAESFVKQTLAEEGEITLFTGIQKATLDEENRRIAFKTAADRAAKDAEGYFDHLIKVLGKVPDPENVTMTNTIRDILAGLVKSDEYFRVRLQGLAPQLRDKIEERVVEMAIRQE